MASAVATASATGFLAGFFSRGLEIRRTTGAGESGSGVASVEGSLWGMWEVKAEMLEKLKNGMAKDWKGWINYSPATASSLASLKPIWRCR
jgi:hypothetical protein